MLNGSSAAGTAIIVGIVAFVLSLLVVPLVRKIALRAGVLDNPQQGKMHTGATPYFGGLAIGLAALLIPSLSRTWTREAAFIGLGAITIAVCGLIDDLRDLHPFIRLGIEIMAAALAVHAGAKIGLFGDWRDAALTIVWLVVITNSFNLLDNMDGVAGTIATATAGALVVAAILQDQVLEAIARQIVVENGCERSCPPDFQFGF